MALTFINPKMMPILITLAAAATGMMILKLMWILRMGCLAHWSYLVGSYIYPQDLKPCLFLAGGVFSFCMLSSIIPSFLFPRLKLFATALSVPPQVHMVIMLHKNLAWRIQNESLNKAVLAYTAVNIASTVWTIGSLLF